MQLSQKQGAGAGASLDTQEKMRQLACTFMEAVGQRMGLYVRRHLRSVVLTLALLTRLIVRERL